MRNFIAKHNMIAVSANDKETAINTEQTLDTTILFNLDNVINLERRREANDDEASGMEEADLVYDLGTKAIGSLSSDRAQPQHIAFLLAYALGAVSTAAAGAGYEHTITPIDGDEDEDRSNPSFTLAQQFGDAVMKRRFASCFVNSVSVTFPKDDWLKVSGDIIGTGKHTNNFEEEDIAGFEDDASLTLAANAVEGATAAERLNSVHRIRVDEDTFEFTEVEYSAVSAATPAVITITAPSASHDAVTFKVLYVPDESGWMTFPAKVAETPLRVSQVTLKIGGQWDGTDFQGGRTLSSEVKEIVYNINNNGEIEFTVGASGTYATRMLRMGREQTITLSRELREAITQSLMDENEEIGVYILAEGGAIDGSHNYQAEFIFPSCSFLQAPISVDGKRLAEAGDLRVLEDATYGSVIVNVKNVQATYAA